MFKPVTSDELNTFDEETRSLYSKRANDPRLSYVLATVPRRERHNLPVIVDTDDNEYMQTLEAQKKNFPYKFFGLWAFFGFAAQRFTKAYYPYGIIVRRAVPTTTLMQASFYAPMLGFFAYSWWMYKEHPRSQRCDLSDPNEK